MKTWLKAAGVLAALVWLAGCTGIPVDTDYDPDYKLSLTSSYAWMEAAPRAAERDPVVENDLLARRVQRAVDAELAAQGLQRVDADQNPELLVTYHAGETEKMDIDTTDRFYGYYGYYPCWHCWGPGPYGPWGGDVWVRYYTEGSLVIDVVDAKTRKLVWRGATDRRIPKFKTPLERDAFVRESVAAIFQHFPPGHKPAR
jgi:hypothetical protein